MTPDEMTEWKRLAEAADKKATELYHQPWMSNIAAPPAPPPTQSFAITIGGPTAQHLLRDLATAVHSLIAENEKLREALRAARRNREDPAQVGFIVDAALSGR